MFENVTVFHSDLRKVSKDGPVKLRFTNPKVVLDSKWDGKMPFAPFRIEGDNRSFTLQVENDHCRGVLESTVRTGVWYNVVAVGGKDKPADIILTELEDQRVQRQGGGSKKNGDAQSFDAESLEETFWASLDLAADLAERLKVEKGVEMTPGDIQDLAVSIHIACEKGGRPIRYEPPEPGTEETGEIATLEQLNVVEDLLEERAVTDELKQKIEEMINTGMTAFQAAKTIELLKSTKKRGEEALPWEGTNG